MVKGPTAPHTLGIGISLARGELGMNLCAEGFYIEITGERDGRIFAKVLPEGRALLDRLRAEQEREREAKP